MCLKTYENWFEGTVSGYTSTNNEIESTKSSIKKNNL